MRGFIPMIAAAVASAALAVTLAAADARPFRAQGPSAGAPAPIASSPSTSLATGAPRTFAMATSATDAGHWCRDGELHGGFCVLRPGGVAQLR